VLVLKRIMGPGMSQLLAGLDHYVITGNTIGEGWKPEALTPQKA